MVGSRTRHVAVSLVLLFSLTMITSGVDGQGPDNQPPVAHIGSILPFPAQAQTELTFKGTGQDDDGYIVRYEWDFDGDGVYDWNSSLSGTTTTMYDEAGTYQPKFKVKDNNGTWSEENTVQFDVGPPPEVPVEDEGYDWGGQFFLIGFIVIGLLLIVGTVSVARYRTATKIRIRSPRAKTVKGFVQCPVCTSMVKEGDGICEECGADFYIERPAKPMKPLPSISKLTAVTKASKDSLVSKAKALDLRKVILKRRKKTTKAKVKKGGKAPSYIVEEVFLVCHDGRVMAHVGQVDSGTDFELVGGMFSAVMDFVKDSFGRPGYLGAIEYGDNRILVEMGQHSFLAAVIYGEASNTLREQVEDIIPRVETYLSGAIEKWNGDRTSIAPAREFLAPLVMQTAGVTRREVQQAIAEEDVKLVSAWEYYQGYIRLKVACKNFTPTVITDMKLDLDYDHKLLRWDHIEPDFKRDGSRIEIGNVEGGSKRTVAVAFDPLMCQETYLNALATYKDAQGELHTVKMKRRPVEVVCPLFFTPENASTATIQRLIAEKLTFQDSKVYLLAERLKPTKAFEMAKQTLEGRDVKFVKQYIQPEPYMAEAWYYGVTKVRKDDMVVRISVDEEAGLISLYSASEHPNTLAGLLAELGHDLAKLTARLGVKLVAETDRLVKEELLAASHLLKEMERNLEAQDKLDKEKEEPEPTDIVIPVDGKHKAPKPMIDVDEDGEKVDGTELEGVDAIVKGELEDGGPKETIQE